MLRILSNRISSIMLVIDVCVCVCVNALKSMVQMCFFMFVYWFSRMICLKSKSYRLYQKSNYCNATFDIELIYWFHVVWLFWIAIQSILKRRVRILKWIAESCLCNIIICTVFICFESTTVQHVKRSDLTAYKRLHCEAYTTLTGVLSNRSIQSFYRSF